MSLFFGAAYHFRQSAERLCHTSHLAGNVHIPHLVAVAGSLASFLATAFRLHISAVVQTIPHPKSHVLGNEQCLVGNRLVVDVESNVDESSQLLVDGVVGSPNPFFIVIRAVAFDECRVLGWDGIDVAVAVVLPIFFVFVESCPCAFQREEFFLWCQIASLPIASKGIVPNESAFLALAQFIDHAADAVAKRFARGFIL